MYHKTIVYFKENFIAPFFCMKTKNIAHTQKCSQKNVIIMFTTVLHKGEATPNHKKRKYNIYR